MRLLLLQLFLYFNPRSRKGSDEVERKAVQAIYIDFNPRSRKGSDKFLQCLVNIIQYFNPRSRKGSDFGKLFLCLKKGISIHAPARGATRAADVSGYKVGKFQSTLPQGERHGEWEVV